MSEWLETTVAERTDWAPGLMTLRFVATLDAFEPGQFVNIALDETDFESRRSYSVASKPGAPLELFVTRVEDGAVTPGLFDKRVGDTIHVNTKAAGFFTLSWVPDAKHLWLIATGTGLGPFISILRSDAVWSRFERIIVVHGVRLAAHLAYQEELRTLSERYQGRLSYVPLVSREQTAGALAGRIPQAVESGALAAAAGVALAPETSHVMLCGNPEMIKDTIAALEQRGMRRHKKREPGHYTTEKYW